MQILSSKQNKTNSRLFATSTIFLISFFIISLPALAQDTDSIKALRQMGKAFAAIVEKTLPAVVGVKTEKTVMLDYSTSRKWPFEPFEDDFFDYFFHRQPRRRSQPRSHQQRAQGSGFIISPDGYILTNNHLVGEAEKVMVKLTDNRDFEAKVIGTDPESDIAVIKIEANDLPFLELADSDALEVGEWVLAIGNPFGLSSTVTAGIVSAKGRIVGLTAYDDFIQTDAAINPGNSGGPLLNLDGKAVGINTAIISRTGGNMGIGLAIPVNMAKLVYKQLIEGGAVVRGFLGVLPQNLTPEMAESLDLKGTEGLILPHVTEDSAADKAGIKKGDIIVEFNGQPVENANGFRRRVAMLKPGTKVEVVVLRDGKRKTFKVELGERPKMGGIAAAKPDVVKRLGLTVQALTDDLADRMGYRNLSGVVVTEVEQGSEAGRKGITRGMLIMEVNRTQVSSVKEFNKAIEKASKGESILLLVTDGRYAQFVVLDVPGK